MLQNLRSLQTERDCQVAGGLLLGRIGFVPTMMAHEIVHLLSEFFEIHNLKIIPENAKQEPKFIFWTALSPYKPVIASILCEAISLSEYVILLDWKGTEA